MSEFEIAPVRQLHLGELRTHLATEIIGNADRIVYVPTLDSTNTLAMQLARDGAEEGVVVLTDSQINGKGRQGRRWIDVAGRNALTSTVLRPLFPPYILVMVASLAVVDAIADTCGIVATIKWPNDVLIEERKVAGILIETSHDRTGHLVAVLGIGVNVNGHTIELDESGSHSLSTDTGLRKQATTLEEVSGQYVSREAFIAHLLYRIETTYLALQREAQTPVLSGDRPISRLIREQWRNRLSTLGRSVQVRQGNVLLSGVAEDVNDEGELLLRRHSGEYVTITWGDVN